MNISLKEWKEYGEYSLLKSSPLYGIKLRILKKLNLGEYPLLVNCVITYKCNSRCRMCKIWKMKSKEEISVERISEIFSDKIFRKVKLIKIMGGEPTLHSNFSKIIETLTNILPNSQIVVSTNGFPFERMKKIIDLSLSINPDIVFSLSVDGIGKVHDMIRGVNGCFKEVNKTAHYLFELSKKLNKKLLRFSFTITPWNYKEIEKVIEYTEKFDTYIGIRLMQISRNFYRNDQEDVVFSEEALNFVEKVLLKKGRNFFQRKIIDVYRNGRKIPCFAFITNVTIEPDGTIKPCIYSERTKIKNLSEVWNKKEGRKIRKKIENCKKCWTDCQTIPDIRCMYFL